MRLALLILSDMTNYQLSSPATVWRTVTYDRCYDNGPYNCYAGWRFCQWYGRHSIYNLLDVERKRFIFQSGDKVESYREILMDVVVIGAGPAGLLAALRAAELGARTILVTRGEVGGMAANDGPIPVRTLAHAARLLRNAKQLGRYGISVGEPILDYPRLLARTREVVQRCARTCCPARES